MQALHEWPIKNIQANGFARLESSVGPDEIAKLLEEVENLKKASSAGIRNLLQRSWPIQEFAISTSILGVAQSVIGKNAKPIKAILFDKTAESNWYVTWHQDLTVAVKQRIEVAGFGPWSIKDSIPHVQPTVEIMQNIIALRIHLDDCCEENGAIKFIPGSHDAGVMTSDEIASYRKTADAVFCPAKRGDIIVMRPLILHSSSQSLHPQHRRVLHLEYASIDLPGGLEWADANAN